jgi:hypothetical protein
MGVYFNKARGSYYLRESVNGVRHYSYTNPETGRPYATKHEAREALPAFILSLTDKAKKGKKAKPIMCDDLMPLYIRDLKGRLKPNTFYGVKSVLERFVFPLFRKRSKFAQCW